MTLSADVRVIASLRGDKPGPSLVAIGAVHGNEPAGLIALKQVAAELEHGGHGLARGEFTAFTGNLRALERRERYVTRDLNRRWTAEQLERSRSSADAEDREQWDLHQATRQAIARARGPVYVVDLHTMSGPGRPFTVFADTIASRTFARRFPNPIILGMEEHLDGAMIDLLAATGHAAIAVEGGQHDDPSSVDNLRSVIWVALAETGLLSDQFARRVAEEREHLKRAVAGVPGILEIRERYEISPDDQFQMAEGFASFDRVVAGQVVAHDREGPITASRDAYLLMPLYQRQGNDGFFLATPVRAFWLALSRVMRRARLGRYVHWLPGLTLDPGDPDVLIANRRVARWVTLELLHLLGYRRVGQTDVTLRVRRRPHDLP